MLCDGKHTWEVRLMVHYPKTATIQILLHLRGSSSSPRLIFLSSDTVGLYSYINIYSHFMHACADKTSIRKTQKQPPWVDRNMREWENCSGSKRNPNSPAIQIVTCHSFTFRFNCSDFILLIRSQNRSRCVFLALLESRRWRHACSFGLIQFFFWMNTPWTCWVCLSTGRRGKLLHWTLN